MILREIKSLYIKNRLTEGVDFLRKDSLKGDGRAYIDTGVTDLSESEYIKFEMDDSNDPAVRCMGCDRNTKQGYGRLCFGWQGDSSSGGGTIYMWSDTGTWGANNNRRKWTLDLVNNAAYTGSMSKTTGLVFPKKVQSFVLFGVRTSSGTVNILSRCTMWSFEVHNQINLVPCQLLKSIPATLDANNKARAAGECGMYDSISGKFYGNVANSGTFTVEGDVEPETHSGLQQIYQNKLIEGVDYETADWLKTELIGTNASMMNLPVHSYSFAFSRKMLSGTNVPYFGTEGGSYSNNTYINTSNSNTISIWNPGQGLYYTSGQSFDRNNAISIISSNEKLVVNSQDIPQYTFPVKGIYFGANDNNGTENYTSSIKVDGVTRYAPCQLLRSIPRNLDAQCKERVAGECGMIDLISGKFYGNVASSGTFTVENDNE